MLREALENAGRLWCRLMHPSVMYGGGRSYQCRTCLRRYSVPWAPQPVVVERAGVNGATETEPVAA
jgi:hypothetical protein